MATPDINEIVAEIISNKTIVTWDGVRHACRLLLMYADYSDAALEAKRGPARHGDQRQLAAAIMATFKDLHEFLETCERTWADYQAADWSRGAFDVWNANNDKFCAELERHTRTLTALKEKHFGKHGPNE